MIQRVGWTIAVAVSAAVLQVAPSALAQWDIEPKAHPDAATQSASRPLSAQLLMLGDTTSALEVSRGGVVEPDLLAAVSGSARAEELMRSAQGQIPTGTVLMYAGLGVGLSCLATEAALLIANGGAPSATSPGVTAALVTGAVIGMAITTIGAVIAMNGYHDALDAINFYNDDLVDDAAAPIPGAKPLSAELIHIRLKGLGFEYTRDGSVVGDLSLAVAGSPRAVRLTRQGEHEASTGELLFYAGIAIGVPCALAGLWIALDALNNPFVRLGLSPSPTVLLAALLVGAVVGLGIEIVGVSLKNSGREHLREGINAYNADLVDGRLDPPAARALPQG